jgi:hypothetical protein
LVLCVQGVADAGGDQSRVRSGVKQGQK